MKNEKYELREGINDDDSDDDGFAKIPYSQ